MDNTSFDETLFSVLKECRTLPHFFEVVFGFLRRRSDFYVIASEPNSPVGLPPGLAEGLVKHSFYKCKPLDSSRCEEVPEAIVETEVETSHEDVPVLEAQIDSLKVEWNSCNQQQFSSSESYNGAVYENYSWSQTISEIGIIVRVPQNITTKNLMVLVLPNKISVKIKDSGQVLLEGELCQKCKHADAIWSLDKCKLEIHIEKVMEMWWDCLIRNEPKLDLSQIDCSRPYEELSQEAQAKIEELTWNQEQRRLGLPTSEELHLQEKLKKAWNIEGSPFKGAYDPNAVIFN